MQTDTINSGIDHANENPINSPILSPPQDNLAALAMTTKVPAAQGPTAKRLISRMQSNKIVVGKLRDLGAMLVPQGERSVLGSVPDVGFLANDSTLIVKGTVLETKTIEAVETGGSVLSEMAGSIQVDSALKGKIEGDVITVEYPVGPGVFGIWLNRGDYALYFLKGGKDGKYSFADPITGRMPITSRKISMPVGAQTAEDKLEAELSASLTDPDRNVALTALEQIGNLGHGEYGVKPKVRANTLRILGEIATSGDLDSRGLAYAALIKLQDYSLLQPAVEFAEKEDGAQAGRIFRAISEMGDVRLREAIRATDDPDWSGPRK